MSGTTSCGEICFSLPQPTSAASEGSSRALSPSLGCSSYREKHLLRKGPRELPAPAAAAPPTRTLQWHGFQRAAPTHQLSATGANGLINTYLFDMCSVYLCQFTVQRFWSGNMQFSMILFLLRPQWGKKCWKEGLGEENCSLQDVQEMGKETVEEGCREARVPISSQGTPPVTFLQRYHH